MQFSVDKGNKKITVRREFAAPVAKVWAAWTESALLDQWWAPKPWKAKTKTMDFRVGGHWLYAMQGPDGSEHWSRADYTAISPMHSFTGEDGFCDEQGNINPDLPRMSWTNTFEGAAASTIVNIEITFESVSDLEKIIEMGFKEGFTAGLENLDALLSAE